jgi:hypothetical protein
MDWLNLHLPTTLRSPAFIGSDPVDRATWLCLLAYSAAQENSGIIHNCRDWKDRRWQQLAAVTREEVRRQSDLWTWHGNDLHVTHYPIEKEQEVQQKREIAKTNGKKSGGRPRNQHRNPQETNVGYSQKPTSVNSPKAEGEGEGEGEMEREVEAPRARAAAAANAAKAEKLINAHPRPSFARPALEAALECVSRHPERFDEIYRQTIAYADAVAKWPADERLTYLTTCPTWFSEDRWRDHPDSWKSRRASRKSIAQADAPPPIDIGGRRHKTLAPALNGHTTTANQDDESLKF